MELENGFLISNDFLLNLPNERHKKRSETLLPLSREHYFALSLLLVLLCIKWIVNFMR